MTEAMLRGWRAQQKARGLQDSTIAPRERLVHAFIAFTNEYPWKWGPGHVEEWTLSLAAEKQLAASTIRGYQTELPPVQRVLVRRPLRLGRQRARRRWGRGCTRCRSAMSGTPSRT